MGLEQITAHLIAAAIRGFIEEGDFGLLARSLPSFDGHVLCEALELETGKLRLALIGFDEGHFPESVATTVEEAITWRNDSRINVPIVVILSAEASHQQEKIHSLELLKPFTDSNLRHAICYKGEQESTDTRNKWLWHALTSDFLPLVASQMAALYYALREHDIATSLPQIGLLPDPELDHIESQEDLRNRLRENWENVLWLSELDSRAYRTLARALPSKGLQRHSHTFRQIKEYTQAPSMETLKELTLSAVMAIRAAPKAPEELPSITAVSKPRKGEKLTPGQYLVGELLRLDPNEDQQRASAIDRQAQRISEMFYEELSDDYESDTVAEKSTRDETNDEDRYEVLTNHDGDEIASARYPESADDQHPLHELMNKWVHPFCWGGHINITEIPQGSVDVTALFDGAVPLPFSPFQPIEPPYKRLERSSDCLLTLFAKLEERIAASTGEKLNDLLLKLHQHRVKLTHYRKQFLYYPNWALHEPELKPVIEAYLTTYEKLAHRLRQVYMVAKASFLDTVERATAQFLALDSVIIEFPHKEKGRSQAVLLTTLHPLHLWKWYELAKLIQNNQQELTDKELDKVCEATESLPTLLNTFFLHPQMFAQPHHLDEPRLVLAGEIINSKAELNIGIPYYEPIAHQSPTANGLREFANLFDKFLTLYPPARLGLVIALIDPPTLSPILEKLAKLHNDETLHGAKIHVYHTDERIAAYDDWQGHDDEALQLFRDAPRWTITVKLEYNSYAEIGKQLADKRPHLILLCNPSEAVAQPIFRTLQEQTSPFGIPVQLNYDSISDTIRLVPVASGGIFDIYAGVRNALSGELQSSSIGVGNRRTIDLEDLQVLIDPQGGANWLIIIDRPHGTLELPNNVGHRLAWYPVGSRTLAVHTNKRDWEEYWVEELGGQLRSLEFAGRITPESILESLLELFPILPQGLVAVINKLDGNRNLNNAFSSSAFGKVLAIATVSNWYRQHSPGIVLIPIDTDDFADWYRESRSGRPEDTEAHFAAFWLEENILYVDILTIHSIWDTFDGLPDLTKAQIPLDQSAQFALTLEMLFDESINTILTPIRRALLREQLSIAIFAGSGDVLGQSRESKARWATVINNLYNDYRPQISLLDIRVALQETVRGADEQYYRGEDGFRRGIVKLPGTFSQFTPPATTYMEVGETVRPKLDSDQITVPPPKLVQAIQQRIEQQAEQLRRILISYGIAIAGIDTEKTQVGSRFIRYWVRLQPPAGRLGEVQRYAVDIARELGSKSIPFIDNIPGEKYIGIDLAREDFEYVPLTPALADLPMEQPAELLIAMGQNPGGGRVKCDLARLPHMLVSGSTGSGKTMFLWCLITSLVWRHSANEIELLLVDPKQMDFVVFENLPHLYRGRICYEPEEAITALRELTNDERSRRTRLLREARCPNILEYNRRNPSQRLPWIVVVSDEFADIMLTLSRKEREVFEKQINRLAATGRAVGIHLVLATQRPTTDIVTGTVKANIPARISFRLPSVTDSRTILDRPGAENLLGQGDMLASFNGALQRLQGYYVSYNELVTLLGRLVALH
jgi:hypothetical protein